MQRWKVHSFTLHEKSQNALYFSSQVMCKGREPKRNIRGRIVSLPKFKNESELTDRSGPERFIDDRHQPVTNLQRR